MRSAAERLRAGAALALLLVTAGACGNDGAVGELVNVFNPDATLDGELAEGGQEILGGALLATNATGVVAFRLREPSLTCKMFPNAIVEILGQGEPTLRYVDGATVCDAPGNSGDPLLLAARNRSLEVVRGVFRVDASSPAPQVQVQEGEVAVTPPSTDDAGEEPTQILRSEQQLAPSGEIEELDPTTIPRDQYAAMTNFGGELELETDAIGETDENTEAAETTPPDSSGSPTPDSTKADPTPTTPPTHTLEPEAQSESPAQTPSGNAADATTGDSR